MTRSNNFDSCFRALTGNKPFPWQEKLFKHFVEGDFAACRTCRIPTGLGKTSLIAAWLIALAQSPHKVPRRLTYVVNRRTVVDQTTDEVLRIRNRLNEPPGEDWAAHAETLRWLAAELRALSGDQVGEPLAISTLRGQFADNREWSANPARPAVICGTVDMIGSRLLFSGYGVGFKSKPLHAGFLGHDSLVVHDEAHLEPSFQRLLETIEKEQNNSRNFEFDSQRRIKIIELTATARSTTKGISLGELDHNHPVVRQRVNATKQIQIHPPIDDEKKLPGTMSELALAHRDCGKAVLIYARSVATVKEIADKLLKEKQQVNTLTGTIRGLERDQLVRNPIFVRFLPESNRPKDVEPASGSVYLVCTSAGEVGVNISADHLVCDLTTFDGMAQRFGRVNRFGECTDTRIDIVYSESFGKGDKISEYDLARQKTLDLLRKLNGDGSPQAISRLDQEACVQAFAPPPTILPAPDILFDAWSLTTIKAKLPGRPDVEPYLHGIAENAPQTTIAWRAELDELEKCKDLNIPEKSAALQAIFTKHRIRPHETMTVGMVNVREKWKFHFTAFLEEAVKKHPQLRDIRLALVFARGVLFRTISELIEDDGILRAEPTVVLPASFGGVNEAGFLSAENVLSPEVPPSQRKNDGEETEEVQPAGDSHLWKTDVADEEGYELNKGLTARQRILIHKTNSVWSACEFPSRRPLMFPNLTDSDRKTSTKLVRELAKSLEQDVRLVRNVAVDDDGDSVAALVCLSPARNAQGAEGREQSLKDHVQLVVDSAKRIADNLQLTPVIKHALLFAAKWHDEGKKAPIWQRYIGRKKETPEDLGKAADWRNPQLLAGYRHEFGSLLRIEKAGGAALMVDDALTVAEREEAFVLALHLIAAHHGHARPHFPRPHDVEFSDERCESAHITTIQRYGRLQRKYGRWGLAYLESLLRAADAAASAAVGIDPDADDDDSAEPGGGTDD